MATLKLNIYKKVDNKNVIDKTYISEGYDLMLGTLEEVLNIIDVDKLNDKQEVTKMAIKGMSQIKPLLLDIFPEATSEELNRTKLKELLNLIIDICAAAGEALDLLNTGKN